MSRYAEAHKMENWAGPGDARPTGLDIVRDEKREGDLKGKVVVITGCSSGIGPTTAAAMAATGATLYCTARNLDKAREALGPKLLDSGRVHLLHMDQASLASVKACADKIRQHEPKQINILINNAGVMAVPTRTLTQDGFEMQMGTNHLSHFYLFMLLRDLLEAGSTPAFASRVVNVSSSAHRYFPDPVHLDDLQLAQPGAYEPILAYAASKTANIYMANAIERKYGGHGTAEKEKGTTAEKEKGAIHAYSLMPGGIRSSLQQHLTGQMVDLMESPTVVNFMKNAEQGSATTVFAAVARELEGRGGVYLDECQVAGPVAQHDDPVVAQVLPGYAPWAFNTAKEEALWTASLKAVGLDANTV